MENCHIEEPVRYEDERDADLPSGPQPDLEKFQSVAFDPRLSGTSPDIDGSPMKRRNRASLAPRAFHQNAQDPTLNWFFANALTNIEALLEEEAPTAEEDVL